MRTIRANRTYLAILFALAPLVAAPARAQNVVPNPPTVSFVPSDDHTVINSNGEPMVTGYDLEVFRAGTAQPLVVVNIGKPEPAGDGLVHVDLMRAVGSAPVTGVPLEARVAAVGPTGRGESLPSNLFQFDGNGSAQAQAGSASVSVRITQPAYGATLHSGATVTISAIVSGAVSGVDFYANGRPIGTATTAPYSVRWRSNVGGRYVITAVTVDKNGVQAASSPIVVTFGRVPPQKSVPDGKATGRR